MNSYASIANLLLQQKEVALLVHQDPDGDALGSAGALALTLQNFGIQAKVICKDAIPPIFDFLNLPPIGNQIGEEVIDILVTIDCGDAKRTGFYDQLIALPQNKIIINIDHHPPNDLNKLANHNLIDESVSSSSELIYQLIGYLKVKINPQIATLLLTGIYTDTGGFKHANASSQTLEIAAQLIASGGKLKLVARSFLNHHRFSGLRLWGLILSRLKINRYQITCSVINQTDIQQLSASVQDLAGVTNLLASISQAKAGLLLLDNGDGTIKGSLRTEHAKINVGQLAEFLGGGGHRQAAGFVIPGRLFPTATGWSIIS